MTIKRFILLIVTFACICANHTYAQYGESSDDQKAKIIYEIPRSLIWENDEDINLIYIGVVNGSPQFLRTLRKEAKKAYPGSGTKVMVEEYASVEEAYNAIQVHLLYVPQKRDFETALKRFARRPVALATDNYSDASKIMINLIDEVSGKVSFKYSSANLRKVAISVDESLTKNLHGEDTSADDLVKEAVKETNAKLTQVQNQLNSKNKELADKQRQLTQKEKEITEKEQTIQTQNKNIAEQKKAIDEQTRHINEQKAEMSVLQAQQDETQRALDAAAEDLRTKTAEMAKIEAELRPMQEKLAEQQRIAAEQQERLNKVDEEIAEKESALTELSYKYNFVNHILMISLVALAIFVVMAFFIFFLYRGKRRDNKKLAEQNIKIEQQKEELAKLSIVADKTDSAVMILDPEGNFEWINHGFTRLYGYNIDTLKENAGSNIRQASKNEKIDEIIDNCIRTKSAMLYENEVTTADGEEKWAQTSITPVADKNGNVSKLILIDSDITALKKAHEEIRQQRDEIEAQKEKLESVNKELEKLSLVASKTDNSVIIASADGEIEWVNDGFKRMTGYNYDEYREKFGSNLLEKNTDVDVLSRIETNLLEKKSTLYTTKSQNAQGGELWIQTNLTPIFDSQDNLYKIVAIDSDITQIKKAEEEIAAQKDKIVESIRYAQKIQQAVMPPVEYFDKYLPEHFILLKPKDIVSGDFYWGSHVGSKFVFTAADCTGHGVPGAFMSLLGIAFLNEITGRMDESTVTAGEILTQLRSNVMTYLRQSGKEDEQKDGMDMALCVYDRKNDKLQYAGAHNPLVLIRNNELQQYEADEMPIGYYQNQTDFFTNHEIDVLPGDVIYMFSDGYPDQFGMVNGRKKKYMIKRFRDYLLQIHNEPLATQKQMLDDNLTQWRGNIKQLDDVSVIGVRF
ncbi:MAG: YfiR/HmsC family protein [Bacteroidales bacterium]|nr:YfiR/HmsC family protein [Bacteroidales bacterium]